MWSSNQTNESNSVRLSVTKMKPTVWAVGATALASQRLLEFPLHGIFVIPELDLLVPKSNLAESGEPLSATDKLLAECPIHTSSHGWSGNWAYDWAAAGIATESNPKLLGTFDNTGIVFILFCPRCCTDVLDTVLEPVRRFPALFCSTCRNPCLNGVLGGCPRVSI